MAGSSLHVLEGADWRSEWNDLDEAARRRIEDVVERGLQLEDPAEAALAVELARRRRRAVARAAVAAIAGVVATLLLLRAGDLGDGWPRVVGGSVVTAAVALDGYRRRGRFGRAERANRSRVEEALAAMRPPPPERGSVGDLVREWWEDIGMRERPSSQD